ncbi:MAG TPA: dihydrodipicolinate synthase family protein [Anaerolineae bacterium]|nr:dihydrodipicolinate synthase family protein [Anaerolineae bacterium]
MFEGIYPPIPTPFDADGALALDRLRMNVEKWNLAGLSGYVAMGSNGEAPHLSLDEGARLVAATRKAALPSMKVIAGTGQLSTWATVEATKRAADAGADAVLVVTPYYYKGGMTADALKRHYFTVADASPVPVLLYNVPANTGYNIPVSVLPEVAAHDNIAGIKDSAGDIGQLAEMVRLTRGMRFEVLSGSFSALLPSMAFGVRGAILAVANVAPKECMALFEAARAGRMSEAGDLHLRILPVAGAVTRQFGVPGLKAALDLLGYYGGVPREPLLPASESVRKSIAEILREAELVGSSK